MTISKLTLKQQMFAEEYIIDFNATRAALAAGYSKKTAASAGARLLINVKVQTLIAEKVEERTERCGYDADKVLKRLIQIDELDVIDILNDDGTLLPIRQWPKAWRTTINSLDVNEIVGLDTATLVKKVKWPDKTKNLELLGKHVDVQAWKEKVEFDGNLEVKNLIQQISSDSANNGNDSPLPKDQ